MISKYNILGVSCSSCVEKITSELLDLNNISKVKLFNKSEIHIYHDNDIDLDFLNNYLIDIGNYKLLKQKKYQKIFNLIGIYKPLIILFTLIFFLTLIFQIRFESFKSKIFIREFISFFFILFSLLKIYDLKSFSKMFNKYDIISKKIYVWGYIYPFIEFLLGILFLYNFIEFERNLFALIFLFVSSIGVLNSVLKNEKIKCACMGSFFDLPMSKVTIFENIIMILMIIMMFYN